MVIALACGNGAEPASPDDEAPALPTAGVTTLKDSDSPGTSEIAQALEAAEGSEVTVSGHLIADSDGNVRLCSVLAESLPPQCGGDVIHLLGFDASSVPNSKTSPQGVREIETARWTDSYITVTGIMGIGGLAEVQLSTEAPMTPGVQPGPAVTGMIVPNLRLTFEGVEYTRVEVLTAASPTGPVMCCGTPINMDDMEVVGTGTNHNPDGDASVEVYRPKAGATTNVYTFHPAQTVEASGELGRTDTGPTTWFRWTADVAPPAPLSYEQWCLKWTPGEDCSPSLSLTDQDRSELIRQTLERALIGNEMITAGVLVKDNESVVLSTENINASLVPNIPNRNLILLRPEEIQKKADDQGDFMFLSFDRIEVRGSVVQVVLANTLAKGKDSEKTEGYMGGGYFTVEYQQISGEWVGTAQGVAVP